MERLRREVALPLWPGEGAGQLVYLRIRGPESRRYKCGVSVGGPRGIGNQSAGEGAGTVESGLEERSLEDGEEGREEGALRSLGLECAFHEGFDIVLGECPDLLSDRLSALEDNQGGD